jgi:hypothetical protein
MAATTMWTRFTRRLGFDHNPLRRRADLIEGWLLPGAIAAFLVLGPLAATGVGLWVHSGNVAAEQAEQSWHQVSAVVLKPVAGPLISDNGANSWLVSAPARWTYAGRAQVGAIPVAAGTSQDAVVPLWLNSAGKVQLPPLTPGGARNRVVVGVLFALAAMAILLTALVLAAKWTLDRSRIAGWAAGWLAVGPQWTRHG